VISVEGGVLSTTTRRLLAASPLPSKSFDR
jgi:hypothetical protein